MLSDEELKKRFKVFIDKNDIVHLCFLEAEPNLEISTRVAELVEQAVMEIINKDTEKEHNSLIDLLALENKLGYISNDVRKIYARIISHKQVKNAAVVGSNIFYKVIVNFISQATSRKETLKWFSDREEALKWLRTRELKKKN